MRQPPPEGFDPAYLVTLDEIYHGRWATERKRKIDAFRAVIAETWPDGHPTRLVHVTGTNGKGSVCHYLAQGLAATGVTGSWTGPHVFDYAERIHIGGRPLDHRVLVEIYRGRVEPLLRRLAAAGPGQGLGFPETGILIALHAFADAGARWGMMEVGVGGRYTPLKALPQDACVVTNVGRDHPVTLGSELWQRALEKTGLVAADGLLFTAAEGEALGYVVAAGEAEGAEVTVVGEEERLRTETALGRPAARHEASNLALALEVIRRLEPDLDPGEALAAMDRRLPARFGRPDPGLVVDIAHNADKVAALADRLEREMPGRRFVFVVGLTRRRDPLEVFGPLLPLAAEVIVTGASYAGQDPGDVASTLAPHGSVPVSAVADPREAVAEARGRSKEGVPVVLTGSGYTIDLALNGNPFLRHLNGNYGWRARRDDDR
ncbi:MAG: hypothetical protein AAGD06_01745 [Acidobacteriota bacterium]